MKTFKFVQKKLGGVYAVNELIRPVMYITAADKAAAINIMTELIYSVKRFDENDLEKSFEMIHKRFNLEPIETIERLSAEHDVCEIMVIDDKFVIDNICCKSDKMSVADLYLKLSWFHTCKKIETTKHSSLDFDM